MIIESSSSSSDSSSSSSESDAGSDSIDGACDENTRWQRFIGFIKCNKFKKFRWFVSLYLEETAQLEELCHIPGEDGESNATQSFKTDL